LVFFHVIYGFRFQCSIARHPWAPRKSAGYFSARSFDILSSCLASVASLQWRVAVVPMTFRMRQTSAMTDSRSSALAVASGDEHRGHPGGNARSPGRRRRRSRIGWTLPALTSGSRLTDKRTLVTGSSAGPGETTVKMLAAEGANVVLHGRNEGRAKTVAEAIRVAGGRADVTLDHRTWGRVITRVWPRIPSRRGHSGGFVKKFLTCIAPDKGRGDSWEEIK
jgi:hypothetical protein